MSRHAKLLAQILGGRADANVGVDALRALRRQLGFEQRSRGSHHVVRRAGVEELVHLQRDWTGQRCITCDRSARSWSSTG